MASFNLNKGQSFQIDKGFALVHCGLGWDPSSTGPAIDLDLHLFGLTHRNGDANQVQLREEGSHALCYAFIKTLQNPGGSLKKNADGTFETMDGSMWHEKDDRTGRGVASGTDEDHVGMREESKIVLGDLPADIMEVAVWATIHDADKRKQDFSIVKNAFIEVCDPDDDELCRYQLASEFAGKTAVQVASFMRGVDGQWKFHAVGAGSNVGLGDVINAYLG